MVKYIALASVMRASDHDRHVQWPVGASVHGGRGQRAGLVGLERQHQVGQDHIRLAVDLHAYGHVHVRAPGYAGLRDHIGVECAGEVCRVKRGREARRAVAVSPVRHAVVADVQRESQRAGRDAGVADQCIQAGGGVKLLRYTDGWCLRPRAAEDQPPAILHLIGVGAGFGQIEAGAVIGRSPDLFDNVELALCSSGIRSRRIQVDGAREVLVFNTDATNTSGTTVGDGSRGTSWSA